MTIRRQLAQLRPSSTSAEQLFTSTQNRPWTIDLIILTNNSTGSVDVTIYHDDDGSTYDDTNCVLSTVTLHKGQTMEFTPSEGISGHNRGSSVGVKVNSANTVAFTAYGYEEGGRR